MHTIAHWISQYGYGGIFVLLLLGIVGLPIPDETLLIFTGYLVHKGSLRLFPAVAAACLGSLSGITVSYELGRVFGYYLVHRYGRYFHLTDESLAQAHDWLRRAGRWGLFFGYFMPGIRHLTAYVAGASKLELPIFALFAYTGGLVWSLSFIATGYFLGERWAEATGTIERNLLLGTLIILGIVACYLLLKRRKKGRSPQS
jgi:membrane protein DedA with SNARE-associated domain